jgi:hypothetical protein
MERIFSISPNAVLAGAVFFIRGLRRRKEIPSK